MSFFDQNSNKYCCFLSHSARKSLTLPQIPPEAVQRPKLYSLRIRVMDFDGIMKKSDFLGQMDMQLDVLESEAEVDGWYFLTSRGSFFSSASNTTQVCD